MLKSKDTEESLHPSLSKSRVSLIRNPRSQTPYDPYLFSLGFDFLGFSPVFVYFCKGFVRFSDLNCQIVVLNLGLFF